MARSSGAPDLAGPAAAPGGHGFASSAITIGGATSGHRTSTPTALAGVAVAVLLVAVGVVWLARPMPNGQQATRLGVTVSVMTAVAPTTAPVPVAAAARPLLQAGNTPASLPVSAGAPGRLLVEVADADTDEDGRPDAALVVTVQSNGPAAVAGLAPGDVITAVGTRAVHRGADVSVALTVTRPGDRVVLTVDRHGDRHRLTATLSG